MATDTSLLMGEVIENPNAQDRDVERLLAGFLKSLLEEVRFGCANEINPPSQEER